ncbi:MAG: hypothetical protein ACP5D5_09535 [Acidithiobacillus sp.]|uniref:hypothetical protein n=1 Tax=Acidithiobacillus sp. TaxID=1872118 RepID=UPI003D050CA4
MIESVRLKSFLVRGTLLASLAAGASAPAWASPYQEEIAKMKAEMDAIIASSQSIPKAAPESAIRVKSKGVGDPYPAADRLARENGSRYLDERPEAMQGWDNSSAFSVGDRADPKFDKLRALWENDARECTPLEAHLPGVEINSDLHDFVVPLRELQAYLALQGILFAPFGMRDWETVRFSTYLEADFYKTNPVRREHVKSKLQTFYRIVPFVTTGTPEQVTKAIVKLAAQRGYEDVTPRNVKGWVAGYHASFLQQRVTPNVHNGALLSIDEYDDTLPIKDIFCLVTDDFGRSWLYKRDNPKTGKEYTVRDLSFGYIAQTSAIPLGEATEYFTNAYVDERLARERKMTPEQVMAEREALAERTFREAAKKAPNFQRFWAEVRDQHKKMEKVAAQAEIVQPDLIRRELSKAGMPMDLVNGLADYARETYRAAQRLAHAVVEYLQKRLQSIWQ